GSPADAAGLAAGDTITNVDGHSVNTPDDISAPLNNDKPGDKVKGQWGDDTGRSHSASRTPAARPPPSPRSRYGRDRGSLPPTVAVVARVSPAASRFSVPLELGEGRQRPVAGRQHRGVVGIDRDRPGDRERRVEGVDGLAGHARLPLPVEAVDV